MTATRDLRREARDPTVARRQVHACVRWPDAWVQPVLNAHGGLAAVDDSENFDEVSAASVDNSRGTFDDLLNLRAAHFGDHASGIRERSQLRCAREDALDHPLCIERGSVGDVLA